eukprot:g3157.t1
MPRNRRVTNMNMNLKDLQVHQSTLEENLGLRMTVDPEEGHSSTRLESDLQSGRMFEKIRRATLKERKSVQMSKSNNVFRDNKVHSKEHDRIKSVFDDEKKLQGKAKRTQSSSDRLTGSSKNFMSNLPRALTGKTVERRNSIVDEYKTSEIDMPMLKDFYTTWEDADATKISPYVILPTYAWKDHFNTIVLIAVLYTTIFTPIDLAFQGLSYNLHTLDIFLDILFFGDMVFNFFAAYYDNEGALIYQLETIQYRYVTTYFIFDFLACFPFWLFIGIIFQALILGEVTLILQSLNSNENLWRLKMSQVNKTLRLLNVPDELKVKIHQFYEYLLKVNGGDNAGSNWLWDLSESLRTEILVEINAEKVRQIKLLKGASPNFLNALILRFQSELYMPRDYILRYGNIGRHMYFISRGRARAFNKDFTEVFSEMKAGSCFGEIALITKRARRTANVLAVTYVDCNSLSHKDFHELMELYPSDALGFHIQANLRLHQSDVTDNQKEDCETLDENTRKMVLKTVVSKTRERHLSQTEGQFPQLDATDMEVFQKYMENKDEDSDKTLTTMEYMDKTSKEMDKFVKDVHFRKRIKTMIMTAPPISLSGPDEKPNGRATSWKTKVPLQIKEDEELNSTEIASPGSPIVNSPRLNENTAKLALIEKRMDRIESLLADIHESI